MYKAIVTGRVSTVVPIEVARRCNNGSIREKLLLHTDVIRETTSVYWHALRLRDLELSWIEKIDWVKQLRLDRNLLKTIPNEVGKYLPQVCVLLNCLYTLLNTMRLHR